MKQRLPYLLIAGILSAVLFYAWEPVERTESRAACEHVQSKGTVDAAADSASADNLL